MTQPGIEPFKCVETITILECKQISSNLFKNEITLKLSTYKSYVYPFKYVQTNHLCYIVIVTLQYLEPFNCVQTNKFRLV